MIRSPRIHITDFSEYESGVRPSDWHLEENEGQDWTIVDDATLPGGKGLRIVGGPDVTIYDNFSWSRAGVSNDWDVLSLVKLPTNYWPATGSAANMRAIGARLQPASYAGYFFNIGASNGQVMIQKFNLDDSSVYLATASHSFAANDRVWARLRCQGSRISAKYWLDGGAEPYDPQLVAIDTTFASGKVGANAGRTLQTHVTGYLAAASNGAVAPLVTP